MSTKCEAHAHCFGGLQELKDDEGRQAVLWWWKGSGKMLFEISTRRHCFNSMAERVSEQEAEQGRITPGDGKGATWNHPKWSRDTSATLANRAVTFSSLDKHRITELKKKSQNEAQSLLKKKKGRGEKLNQPILCSPVKHWWSLPVLVVYQKIISVLPKPTLASLTRN